MKNVFISVLFVTLLVSTNAWGQTFDPLSYEDPEGELYVIEKHFKETPLKVGNDFPKAMIHNFAKAFCSQYQKYAPNVAMTLYLKNPANYDRQKDEYYMEDAPRNGYIKCNMPGQFDYLTELCYWKRANGHSLVGVLMQVGHEGEGTITDYAMLFYDYNPSTRIMTPDMTMYQTVKRILYNQPGSANLSLPKEGKDIGVYYVEFVHTDTYDFKWQNTILKWQDDTFIEVPLESGEY
jgi:hypothetical protein